ncbi:MAG: glucoamylase family protein, partial [Candidatus Eisenbacteria bacterium]
TNPDWYGPDFLGIDQGPIVMMIENYRTGAVWGRFMVNADIQAGLTAAGFVSTVGVDPPPLAGRDRPLLWSTPNPFTTSATLSFRLASAGPARLTVHDLMGREVARLLDGWADAGEHSEIFQSDGQKSGVYWYRLSAGGTEVLSKGILIR